MIILDKIMDISIHLDEIKRRRCTVIFSRYNTGKSSVCTDFLLDNLYNSIYATFIDQSKPNFIPRKSDISFDEIVEGKVIIFDEVGDDKGRSVEDYLSNLIDKNKVIILSNPYSDDPGKAKNTFLEREYHIPMDSLFFYVK